jgi:hypothetical protein
VTRYQAFKQRLLLHASFNALFALERSAIIMRVVLAPLEPKPVRATTRAQFLSRHKEKKLNRR